MFICLRRFENDVSMDEAHKGRSFNIISYPSLEIFISFASETACAEAVRVPLSIKANSPKVSPELSRAISIFFPALSFVKISTVPDYGDNSEGDGTKVNPIDFPNICAAYTYDESSDLELWFSFGLDSMIYGWEKYLKP